MQKREYNYTCRNWKSLVAPIALEPVRATPHLLLCLRSAVCDTEPQSHLQILLSWPLRSHYDITRDRPPSSVYQYVPTHRAQKVSSVLGLYQWATRVLRLMNSHRLYRRQAIMMYAHSLSVCRLITLSLSV
ncbi:hypothetical protein BaRGS_00015001 [Batillaria attramentaria]|uniref:Uncharacterized protein n=1 Tax=Batillaria attramentaria TaxID=370345 RepID=A0ABD0L3D5_9CAEN